MIMADGSQTSPEVITISKPDKPTRNARVLERQDFPTKSKDSPQKVSLALEYKEPIAGETAREIKMVSKKISLIDDVPEGKTNAQEYYDRWLKIKESGLPTVPTMRVVSDQEVLMTDLTADGSVIYGKHATSLTERASPPEDRLFMKINTQSIEVMVRKLAQIADRQHITLPTDQDPCVLVVHPNGAWNLVVLDTEMAKFDDPEAPVRNKKSIEDFIANLRLKKSEMIKFSFLPEYTWAQNMKPEKPTKVRHFIEKVKAFRKSV